MDVDGDGDLDLFIAEGTDTPAPRPNRLLLNDGGGRFTDASASHLPATPPANSTKADFGDLDGDGDLDAVVANVEVLDPTTDATFGDIDGDGDLDLVVGNTGENGVERVFVNNAGR